MTVAVVGHVEWADAVRVECLPAAGQIVHGEPAWSVPAGGGGVTAVVLARMAGEVHLFTALGDDELGRRAHRALGELGVQVHAAWRDHPQRKALVHLDGQGERAITVVGTRAGASGADDLPWHLLDEADAAYFTAGDAGAVEHARRARALVATARALPALRGTGVQIDALVGSAGDPGERYAPGDLDPEPTWVLRTEAGAGGSWEGPGGPGRWAALSPPGPGRDSFGCGDSFAAGVTAGLGDGLEIGAAIELRRPCGGGLRRPAGARSASSSAPRPRRRPEGRRRSRRRCRRSGCARRTLTR